MGPLPKAVKLGLTGVIVVVLGRMSARGRLPRNIAVGIRLPSTMRSDAAWRAGHGAAAPALTVAGLGSIAAALVAGVRQPDEDAEKILLGVGRGWLLVWLALATVRASRAARAVTDD